MILRPCVCRCLRAAAAVAFTITLTTPVIAAPFAYIPSSNANVVTVIDLATNAVVGTVAVGRAPSGVATNPVGTSVYVLNALDNSVSVIDAATRTVVATVPVGNLGGNGDGIAISPDGTRVYVVNTEDNTISIIDATSKAVIQPAIRVGQRPLGIAIDSSGVRAYVGNHDSASMSILDLPTGISVTEIALGAAPRGIAIDPNGIRVYVATSDGIMPIDVANMSALATIPFKGARGVAVSPDGRNVYATSDEGHSLLTIDTASGAPVGPAIDVGAAACGVGATTATALVYVANCGADYVSIVSPIDRTVAVVTVPPASAAMGRFISDVRPVAQDHVVFGTPNAATPILLSGSDANNDVLTFAVVDGPAHGTLTGTPPSVSYIPATDYAGPDSFTFKVNDGAADSELATVSLTVPFATSTTLSSNIATCTYGQTVALTASVSAASRTPGGAVQFWDGSVPLGSAALQNGMASLSIASLGAGTHSITALFVPDRPFAPSNSESLTLTVNKATGTAALSLSVLTPQYSDIETFRATFTPAVAGGPAPAKVTFKVGLQVMADAPFIWTGNVYQATWTGPMVESPVPTRQMKPDFHVVTATFTDPNISVVNQSKAIIIQAEDARVMYTGPTAFTLGANATVPLTVTVKDITAVDGDPARDSYPGAIRNAQVSFVDRSTNMIIGTVPVVASESDPTIGEASFNWPVTLGAAKSKSFTIGFMVGYYYRRNSPSDNVTIVVSK